MRLLQGCLAVQPVAFLLWLVAGGSYPLLVVFAVLLGVGYGGFVALGPEVALGYFGVVGLGGVMGLVFLAFGLGGLLGPPLGGLARRHDRRVRRSRSRSRSSPRCSRSGARSRCDRARSTCRRETAAPGIDGHAGHLTQRDVVGSAATRSRSISRPQTAQHTACACSVPAWPPLADEFPMSRWAPGHEASRRPPRHRMARGGRDRRRSGDLPLFRRTLCRLSYSTARHVPITRLVRAVPTGLEPATSGLTGRRELQTSPRDHGVMYVRYAPPTGFEPVPPP